MNRFVKALAAVMLMTMVVITVGCKPDEESNDNGGGNGNNTVTHEYVDLGLPSGTLWATCNVGADTPEGYGYYFAWGETQQKEAYNWSTYKYSHGNSDLLTKYCSVSELGYEGFTDSLTVCCRKTMRPQSYGVMSGRYPHTISVGSWNITRPTFGRLEMV